MIFRVWAPKAAKIAVECNGLVVPMRKESGGWYSAPTKGSAGDDYSYLIDDQSSTPDPRSRWQPGGIHGRSRVLDHSHFRWNDTDWQAPPLATGLAYELHVGTFTPEGTFLSTIDRLDHLVNLGVTHVELMPVNEFSGSHGWGYDSVDIFAPHHCYGEPNHLKQLVGACHTRGLAVIADVVYNHYGPVGNYLERFGPYFTDRYTTPWGRAVNLDGPGSDEVRRFFCDHALMMLKDYHFDGLRLDAVHSIFDYSAINFMEQLASEIDALEQELGRDLILIAESDLNDPKLIRSPELGGYGLDAQWNDDFHHALHTVLTGEATGYYQDFGTLASLAKTLQNAWVYDGCYSKFRDRHHGRSPHGLSGHQFVAFSQNHDQIGNRAKGERSSHLMDADRLKIAAAMLLTAPFVPMLFQGEEWAASSPFLYFTDHQDPQLGDAVREGRRREFAAFGWRPEEIPDPQAHETFMRSKLDWSEIAGSPHREMLDWYRGLVKLRRERISPGDLRLETATVKYDEKNRWLAYERGSLEILCNLSDRPMTVGSSARDLLLASKSGFRVNDGSVAMPPMSIAIADKR